MSSDRFEDRHWFEDIADHVGPAYLRYSFTMGTEQEVSFLIGLLGLSEGMRVLDVGCGPGRHALALARHGIEVVGVDISERFVEVGVEVADREGLSGLVTFERADARSMVGDERFDAARSAAPFDAAISLCQGAFGLGGAPDVGDPQNLGADTAVLAGIAAALGPGGRCAVSAFSSYFQVRWLEETDTFDAAGAVNHERAELLDGEGERAEADLWTTCYTPRELRLVAERAGLLVDHIWSVTPGGYSMSPPTIDTPEFLLVARTPTG
ncbi:MAG: class I SAM-dependent methyltransferase [Actinobacteria bacterium]|nr:class I SAM-dependent methyltransferase [Actinomycetota bacterium]